MKVKKKDPNRFTSNGNPFEKEAMEYILNDDLGCPPFVPMEIDDAIVTNNVVEAAYLKKDVPISELIRRENYNKF